MSKIPPNKKRVIIFSLITIIILNVITAFVVSGTPNAESIIITEVSAFLFMALVYLSSAGNTPKNTEDTVACTLGLSFIVYICAFFMYF